MKRIRHNKVFWILFCLAALGAIAVGNGYSQTPTKVREIRIIGAQHFSESQIRGWLRLQRNETYSEERVRQRSIALLERLRENGYYFAKVDSIVSIYKPDSTGIDIQIFLDEGKLIRVADLTIAGITSEDYDFLDELQTRPGRTFYQDDLEQDIDTILGEMSTNGYPYCKVKIGSFGLDSLGAQEMGVHIELQVDAGPRMILDEIEIRGNRQTRDRVILRELGFQTGQMYNEKEVGAVPSRLGRLGYFKWVNPPRLEWLGKNRGKLLIEVAEGNYNQFNGVIGYNPGAPGRDGFVTGLIDVTFGNLFGTGRRIEAHWQKRTEKSQNLRLKYNEPWVAGIPLNAGLGFEQLIQDTIYVERSLGLDLQYAVSRNLTFTSLVSKRNISPDSLGSLIFNIPRSSAFSLRIGLTLNTVDEVLNPRKGVIYQTSFEWARKTLDEETSPQPARSFEQKRISIDFENYFHIFRWQVLAFALHGRQITSDEPVIPITEQYRLGGTQTLRGYREEQFRGSRIAWGSLEYRYLLGRSSRFFAFVDLGYFFREDLVKDTLRTFEDGLLGYGIGLRVDTRLGFFGIDYGLGEGDGLSQGKVHIRLTNAF